MQYFENFKGFAKSELNLLQPFTILIGPNGAGKSNAIEGIELLSFIARGKPLHEVKDLRTGNSLLEIRGGIQACPRYGYRDFTLGFSAGIQFEGSQESVNYQVRLSAQPYPHIAEEKLFLKNRMLFETVGKPSRAITPLLPDTFTTIQIRYNNFAPGKKPQKEISAQRSALSQYENFAKSNKKYKSCIKLVDNLMLHLRDAFVFDPNPKIMRNYNRIGNSVLSRDGSNLSSVLYALKTGTQEQNESLQNLLHHIRQLPDEPYRDFDFVTTDIGDVIFGLREDSDVLADARILSDGTLRTLAILTALETVEKSSRVVVEEFDNGLHPSRVKVVTGAIQDCCIRRKLNVLVTTHNPATLNELNGEQLDGVVLCIRDNKQKASDLVKLNGLPRVDELLLRSRLGDLVTRRVLEQHLIPNFEGKYKKEALEWLNSL